MAMEEGGLSSEKQPQGASYTYWVREATAEAAPLPVPRKLSSDDILSSRASDPPVLGSVWNRAGTWEEKNLNKWANERMKELLMSIASMEFSGGKAEIKDVTKCVGDVLFTCSGGRQRPTERRGYYYFCEPSKLNSWWLFKRVQGFLQPSHNSTIQAYLVTVRNRKRVGYTYEVTLKVNGEWVIGEEKKTVKGQLDIPEFSFGELDELQMEVRVSEEKDLLQQQKLRICQDLKQFLAPVREKLVEFEAELKER